MSVPQTAPTTRTVWDIDAAHSLIEFSTKHMMFTTVKGRITGVKGTITTVGDNHSESAVDVELDITTISTGQEQRDGHLKSPDFFDAATYPTITFTSTRVEHKGGDTMRVFGNLTMHGETKEVAIDTTLNGQGTSPQGKELIAFTGETKIDRKDFGLNYNMALETGGWLVGNDIKIVLEIQASKRV